MNTFARAVAFLALAIVLPGCASASHEPIGQPNLVSVQLASAKAFATSAILIKYPNYQVNDLVFARIAWELQADGKQSIAVTYDIPKTKRTSAIPNRPDSPPLTLLDYLTAYLTESGTLKYIALGSRTLPYKNADWIQPKGGRP